MATIDLLLESQMGLLKQGSVLIDELNPDSEPRVLFYLENSVQDARQLETGGRGTISREVHFVELNGQGQIMQAGYAPYLDYRHASEEEIIEVLSKTDDLPWLKQNMEDKIKSFAITTIAREHLERVKRNRQHLVEKTKNAVQERLTNEIRYWDHRARDLRLQEEAGKPNAKLNSNEARKRADELQTRMQKRIHELNEESKISSKPPVVIGGVLVIPANMLATRVKEDYKIQGFASPEEKAIIEKVGMQAVFAVEKELNNIATDRSKEKIGYDIESLCNQTGKLRFIEVKGRRKDATTVTITKNEIIYGLNLPDQFILALAFVDGKRVEVHYVQNAFRFEPDFGVTSINFNVKDLLSKTVYHRIITLA
ncbi:MAG: protein NO VEIN domain-containing protein [Spirosomataceae bacterium]